MTTTLDPTTPVGALAVSFPGAPAILERLGIDYCCGGNARLDQVCARKGLQVGQVLDELRRTATAGTDNGRDWTRASMTELTEHIRATHHDYLRGKLPRLSKLALKVSRVHAGKDHRLAELQSVIERFSAELLEHMEKEERVLFPLLRSAEVAGSSIPSNIDDMIACMVADHNDSGDDLARIRDLTDQYTPPEGACGSWRVLLTDLARLERDMHEHVHKENNILFPRAMSLRLAQ